MKNKNILLMGLIACAIPAIAHETDVSAKNPAKMGGFIAVAESPPLAPPAPPAETEYLRIYSLQSFKVWCAQDKILVGRLDASFSIDPDDDQILVPRSHSLLRNKPDCHIDFRLKRNAIQWDGPLDKANVGTALLFKNSMPCYGVMPKTHVNNPNVYGDGGVPLTSSNGQWNMAWMASVHGRMGANLRPASWWDDGRPDWWWLQAMIDSSPKVGTRLNDAEFQLGDQTMIIDRPLSLDMRFCEVRGRGRDIPTLGAVWDNDVCSKYPMKCFFVMSSYVFRATTGFDSKVRNLTINGTGQEDTAMFWGGTRLEEQCEISGITAFNLDEYFVWTNGFNGLWVEDCHIQGANTFTYDSGEKDPDGNPVMATKGSTVFHKASATVGQGHVRVSDIYCNVSRGWFLHHAGNGNIWVRDIDTEGCERLLWQSRENTFVDIQNVNHFVPGSNPQVPLIYFEATVKNNQLLSQASAQASIRNVRLQGAGYGFNWLHDDQMGGDDSPMLQSLLGGFHLREYSRGILLHSLRGFRGATLSGGGYETKPARIIKGSASNVGRAFQYDLKP